MRNMIVKILDVLSKITAITTLIVSMGYLFGMLPNPITALSEISNQSILQKILTGTAGLLLYMALGCILSMLCSVFSRIILIGWSAYVKEQAVYHSKLDAGMLIKVSVDRGSLFDLTISTIETTSGFFRVFGDITIAEKGTAVYIKKKYDSLIIYDVVCLDGKEYQLA